MLKSIRDIMYMACIILCKDCHALCRCKEFNIQFTSLVIAYNMDIQDLIVAIVANSNHACSAISMLSCHFKHRKKYVA